MLYTKTAQNGHDTDLLYKAAKPIDLWPATWLVGAGPVVGFPFKDVPPPQGAMGRPEGRTFWTEGRVQVLGWGG